MIKLLYLTDTHITGHNPRYRLDCFPDTLRMKLQEVADIAVAHRVTAILHGGDLFDLPVPEFPIVSDCMRILMSPGLPIYAIAGNHDMYAYSPATLDRTMIGLLHNLGLIRLLQTGQRVYLKDDEVRVQLTGTHFHHAMDRRDPTLDYCVEKVDCNYAVHVAHGMLLNSPFFEGTPHTMIADVAPLTQADVTLGSHAHFGYPEVKMDGKVFINPGSLVRLSGQPPDVARTPQVVILEFGSDRLGFQYVPLRSARPGSEIVDAASASRSEEMTCHSHSSRKTRPNEEGSSSRIKGIVYNVCREHTISESVRDEALRLIDKHNKDVE